MPLAYPSTQYFEDQTKLHDFYINLGNECKKAERQKQAWKQAQLEKQRLQLETQRLELEEQMLLEYMDRARRVIEESKKVGETNRKLSHAWWELDYTKDKQLVVFPDRDGTRIAWRDSLSPDQEASYREYLRKDLGSDKIDVVDKIV